MQRRIKKHLPKLELKDDGYYEDGRKLEDRDYAFCFNCQHGYWIVSWITGTKHMLDNKFRPSN